MGLAGLGPPFWAPILGGLDFILGHCFAHAILQLLLKCFPPSILGAHFGRPDFILGQYFAHSIFHLHLKCFRFSILGAQIVSKGYIIYRINFLQG